MEQAAPVTRLPSSPLGPPCMLCANRPAPAPSPKQGAILVCQLSLSPTAASSDSTQMGKKAHELSCENHGGVYCQILAGDIAQFITQCSRLR